uniref:Transmembrane protein n=1 Tax=viral metagenome TaxID=1070528 RepID=A0A6C0ER23_9ZZZZ
MRKTTEETPYTSDIEIGNIIETSNIQSEEIEIIVNTKCVKTFLTAIIAFVTLPITIGDLVVGYTDNSCVYICPEQLNVNMKDYLFTCGYINILLFLYNLYIICFHLDSYYQPVVNTKFIYLFILDIIQLILKFFLIIWNLIGLLIFWSKLFVNTTCSNFVFNYLFVTILIKFIISIIFYCKEKDRVYIE